MSLSCIDAFVAESLKPTKQHSDCITKTILSDEKIHWLVASICYERQLNDNKKKTENPLLKLMDSEFLLSAAVHSFFANEILNSAKPQVISAQEKGTTKRITNGQRPNKWNDEFLFIPYLCITKQYSIKLSLECIAKTCFQYSTSSGSGSGRRFNKQPNNTLSCVQTDYIL